MPVLSDDDTTGIFYPPLPELPHLEGLEVPSFDASPPATADNSTSVTPTDEPSTPTRYGTPSTPTTTSPFASATSP